MENSVHIDYILKKVERLKDQFYRLLFIVGPSGNGLKNILYSLSKKIDIPLLNINLEVSRHLLELPEKQRPTKVVKIVENLMSGKNKNTFIFYNIELLFNAALKIDPLRLLQKISRNNTIIVGWNGEIRDKHLNYAVPAHPDYKKYNTKDLHVLNFYAGPGLEGL